ncbi:MAG TPA: hypothetical protein VFS91_05180 [Nitrobacter sp.]|nr:hypothetical protein [Nitrobacter sp.]
MKPTRPGTRALRPIPADFATQALTMTKHALADHYRTHWSTVQRWAEESGIAPYVRQPKPKPEKRIPRPNGYAGPNPAFASRLPHDTSIEGQAADFLRQETRAIIYRCNERGAVPDLPMRRAGREHVADRSGLKFWRIGNTVVTPEELIARARRRGWVSLGELLSGHHGAKGFVTHLALARAEP